VKLRDPRSLTVEQRVAISELVEAAQICAASQNPGVRAVGGLLAERAAKILRGTTEPYVWPDEHIAGFADVWKALEPALFDEDASIRTES